MENKKYLYLTFDDGPHPIYTPEILNLLKKYNAKATFFVIGSQVKKYPNLVYRTIGENHYISNHTYNHKNLKETNRATLISEIKKTEEVILDASKGLYKSRNNKFLRPPFGAIDKDNANSVFELGYRIVLWDIDPWDWEAPPAQKIVKNIMKNLKEDAIILLHDGGGNREQTVLATETLLKELSQSGYTFNSITHLAERNTNNYLPINSSLIP